MSRHSYRHAPVLWSAAVIASAIIGSRIFAASLTVKQIFPASGPGGQTLITVLADHYSSDVNPTTGQPSNDSAAFNSAASRLFVSDLFQNANYSGSASSFAVKSVFDAFPSTDPTNPPLSANSDYGFEQVSGVTDCDITWKPGTAVALNKVAAAVGTTHIVVVGNYRTTSGCSAENWTYLPAGAFQQNIIEHEFGHLLAGLYDEYVTDTGPDPDAPIARGNCSTNAALPHWMTWGLTGITNPAGCDTYPMGIVHPAATCLMNVHATFCGVCRREMDRALAPRQVPGAPTSMTIVKEAGFGFQPVPAPPPGRSVSIVVRVNRQTGAATAEGAADLAGPYAPKYRRFGDYGYEVVDQGQIIATGAVVGNPFEVRSYRGGGSHVTSRADTGVITVVVPSHTKATLANRNPEIALYRIDPSAGYADLTPAEMARLKQQNLLRVVARLAVTDAKRALQVQ